MTRSQLIVLAARAGDPVSATDLDVPVHDRVIAVDSGLHLARALGLDVDLLIGDFDSVDQDLADESRRDGIEVEAHPPAKDRTDLAIALARAVADGAERIEVLGGAGGRLDHGLANLVALADPSLADVEVVAHLGGARVVVVRTRTVPLASHHGRTVSLVAVAGPATVTTRGLRWDLVDDELAPTSSRGISNVIEHDHADVTATSGVVLAIQPADNEALER